MFIGRTAAVIGPTIMKFPAQASTMPGRKARLYMPSRNGKR